MPVPPVPPRARDSHKGDYGRVLIIGGSRGMAGAVALSGTAAVKSGAGLVSLAVPDRILETVAGFFPCYMTVPVPDDAGFITGNSLSVLEPLTDAATSIAIGPGLGRSPEIVQVVQRLYRSYRGPMVVDADALTALSGRGLPRHAGPRILTPHIGEYRRLAEDGLLSVDDCRASAPKFARDHGVIIVLKGPGTLVTDGETDFVNQTGNPGMATGGSGDVLTGTIVALLAQGMQPLDAATLGVHLHGLAGDIAAANCGQCGLDALTLAQTLPQAFVRHATESPGV